MVGTITESDVSSVARMLESLAHRGPDGLGIWRHPTSDVVLGHRRLAIIDLSDDGAQPMAREFTAISFNGEIYNYKYLRAILEREGRRFNSESDTEVLLQWLESRGIAGLADVEGMFAFAYVDRRTRELFLVRDRAGEKPLYYVENNGKLAFASELRALRTSGLCGASLNAESLEWYLTYGFIPAPLTVLRGCHKVAAGCLVRISLDNPSEGRTERYWDIPNERSDRLSQKDPIDAIDQLLGEAVRSRLIADVDVSLLLSGGIDSTLIATYAVEAMRGVTAFTVSFPDDPHLDEWGVAAGTAKALGLRHVELRASELPIAFLRSWVSALDEPLGNHAALPTFLVARAVARETKVVLTGDGGDELFAGYEHDRAFQGIAWAGEMFGHAPKTAARMIKHLFPLGRRWANLVRALSEPIDKAAASFNVVYDAVDRESLRGWKLSSILQAPEASRAALSYGASSALGRMSRIDFRSTLADDYLTKIDRATMACSLEARAPFLERRLIEYALGSLDNSERANLFGGKKILRRLLRKRLPSFRTTGRKKGFFVPVDRWFRGDLSVELGALSTGPLSRIVSSERLAELLSEHRLGRSHGSRLYTLLVLGWWLEQAGLSDAEVI